MTMAPDSVEATSQTAPMPGDLAYGQHIGQALRAARLAKGLSVETMADETRVRRAYLAAIEDFALDQLPSRPFTIGYIKAYAAALGLDGEAAVSRFKHDDPVGDQRLRAPVGVGTGQDPRLAAILLAGFLILGAIILWNIAQRATSKEEPSKVEAAQPIPLPSRQDSPIKLSGPLPAPPSGWPQVSFSPRAAASARCGRGR